MSVYEYQTPRHDLRTHVVEFLRETTGLILDLGCGPGAYSRALRDAGHHVVAADLSHGMTTEAGGAAAVVDAGALPFCPAGFGGVIALHMLYHVPDPIAALIEIRRVLRPGGTLVVSTNAASDKAELQATHAEAASAAGCPIPDQGPADRFNLDEAESITRRLFTSVRRHDLTGLVRVPVPDPVVAFIDSTRAWYGDGPDVIEHVHRLVADTIERDGVYSFRTHSGFLVCR